MNLAVLCLAGLLVSVWVISLSRSLFDPLGDDQALYQYITDRVIVGQKMYVDVWDQNLPGIVGIHWISTHLFGHTAIAFRAFDACWQTATLLALILLGYRDRRRWSVGILAGLLYSLAYYGFGYMQTGQREGFAVLPLLLAAHAIARPRQDNALASLPTALSYFLAGAMCCLAFAIKSPLGLCFGLLWCWTLAQAVAGRRKVPGNWAAFAGLTCGFLATSVVAVMLLTHLGWWSECWRVLIRADMRGYAGGPALIRSLVPEVAIGTVVIIVAAVAWRIGQGRSDGTILDRQLSWIPRCIFAYALLVTVHRWELWRNYIVLPCLGLLIPTFGAILTNAWTARSRIWRILMLLGAASWFALVIQGRFSPYQAMPFVACAAMLAAMEIVDQWPRLASREQAAIWPVICLAAVTHLAVGQWRWTMTAFTTEPYVLASKTLDEHYDRVTKHKLKYPRYATTAQAARRVQNLTAENEPIALLFHDPRVWYYCRRPPVCRFFIILDEFKHTFPEAMQAVRNRKPKVVLARTPRLLKESQNLDEIQSAIFAETELIFGPDASVIREGYRLTEKIDEICILEPLETTQVVFANNSIPLPTH